MLGEILNEIGIPSIAQLYNKFEIPVSIFASEMLSPSLKNELLDSSLIMGTCFMISMKLLVAAGKFHPRKAPMNDNVMVIKYIYYISTSVWFAKALLFIRTCARDK